MSLLTLTPSLILSKYHGESSQRLRAVFTVCRLLCDYGSGSSTSSSSSSSSGGCVLWVDEMDALFRVRCDDDSYTDRSIKNECEYEMMNMVVFVVHVLFLFCLFLFV